MSSTLTRGRPGTCIRVETRAVVVVCACGTLPLELAGPHRDAAEAWKAAAAHVALTEKCTPTMHPTTGPAVLMARRDVPARTVPTTPTELAAARRRENRAIEAGEAHHVDHQLNIYVLDVDSEVTSYGAHNRLVVMGGGPGERDLIYVREDVRGLPMSTEAQRQRVAAGSHRMHPRGRRLVHVSSTPYENRLGDCIEHLYRIA